MIICNQCGLSMSGDTPDGHCPGCLLALAAESEDASEEATLQTGDRVGRYVIGEQIGEGGCGTVFLAEQQEPVRREVALKIIKLGMDTREFITRFAAEQQAMAVLEHPNIARIFDAGATETGRPFFVMELVRGLKITAHADQHHLSICQRLEIFLKVCRAIQHAHQKGIIHRDLKPSNILVENNGEGGNAVPRIIDFGIAKSFKQPLSGENFATGIQQHPGTPAYMSPEQAGLNGLDVDTRTDIYSLGVLLYELLAGTLPFAPPAAAGNREDFFRRLRELEPPQMSCQLASLGPVESMAIAKARGVESSELIRSLRGDLDSLVMKSIEKNRARRYATVSEFIADVENYLHHRPVTARPVGNWYRLGKFLRRNRTVFAVSSALASTLILGAAVSFYQAVRAEHAEKDQARLRQLAEGEALKSGQETRFLADIFKASSPAVAMGRDTTLVREILEQANARIDVEMAGQPVLQSDLRIILAGSYHHLGLYPQMENIARAALHDSRNNGNSSIIAQELELLSDALAHQNKLAEAENVSRESLTLRKKVFGEGSANVSASLNNLGLIIRQRGRVEEAEELFRAAIQIDRRLPLRAGANSSSIGNLGAALWSEGRLNEAEAAYREALVLLRGRLGGNHPDLAATLNNLATVLLDEGKLVEAESLCRQAVALHRNYLGNRHPDLAIALGNLGNILAAERCFEEAESVDRESLEITRALSGVRPDDVMLRVRSLGKDLACQGKIAEAEALFGEIAAKHP